MPPAPMPEPSDRLSQSRSVRTIHPRARRFLSSPLADHPRQPESPGPLPVRLFSEAGPTDPFRCKLDNGAGFSSRPRCTQYRSAQSSTTSRASRLPCVFRPCNPSRCECPRSSRLSPESEGPLSQDHDPLAPLGSLLTPPWHASIGHCGKPTRSLFSLSVERKKPRHPFGRGVNDETQKPRNPFGRGVSAGGGLLVKRAEPFQSLRGLFLLGCLHVHNERTAPSLDGVDNRNVSRQVERLRFGRTQGTQAFRQSRQPTTKNATLRSLVQIAIQLARVYRGSRDPSLVDIPPSLQGTRPVSSVRLLPACIFQVNPGLVLPLLTVAIGRIHLTILWNIIPDRQLGFDVVANDLTAEFSGGFRRAVRIHRTRKTHAFRILSRASLNPEHSRECFVGSGSQTERPKSVRLLPAIEPVQRSQAHCQAVQGVNQVRRFVLGTLTDTPLFGT